MNKALKRMRPILSSSCIIWIVFAATGANVLARDLSLLFMGDNGHHQPARRFQELEPTLKERGIRLTYTDRMSDLNDRTLADFDGLVLYANIDRIEDAEAKALLDFISEGKGFIPLHCATFCWRNNPEMVALMGAQFQRHGGQVFSTQNAVPDHPIMKGYGGFTSWDETYIHHMHNESNRTVLEYRVEGEQADGKDREPWTWVRTHGDGRIFYTAWGHDQRTFTQPGFHNLVERGIRWACDDDPGLVPAFVDRETFSVPRTTQPRDDVKDFEYVDVGPKIPNYTPGANWGAQGKPRNRMQKPLSVDESMKHFVTPEGMAVRHYADERSFQAKPIAMTWDEKGRLWICETLDYPNELGTNRDRIRICEDTDGDHVADKFTVFAEGLSIPTAIVIVRGGAVVQNGTETIYLKDTDGDDVSDEKSTLISNWSLGDTHGGVSNFRYGLDNWIWAMQGYNNSTPKISGNTAQTFRQGFWRFKLSQTDPPHVTDLEFIRSSNNNTWGLGISEEGLIFGSTANHNPSMFSPIPNRYYEKVRGWAPSTLGSIADTFKFDPITENVRQVDQFGGYTAGAGHALYTARAFPRQWWNKTAFVCGPTGHLVGTFVLRRDGANFTSTSPVNLLASDDEWSAPIMAEVGPDGAVWVIDWYNYIIQHNPTPQGFETGKGRAYVSDLRDKKHGRIYRVVSLDGSRDSIHPINDLSQASTSELVAALTHPSFVWRLQAQRLLIEKQARDAIPELLGRIRDQELDAVGLNVGAIHALQTLEGLGALEGADSELAREGVILGLSHPSAGVRRNALAVLPNDDWGVEKLLDHQEIFGDDDAQVRLQAVLTLADMPVSKPAGSLIFGLASTMTDPVLVDALTSAAATHAVSFLEALSSDQAKQPSAAEIAIARRIAEHVARGRPAVQQLETIVRALSTTRPQLALAVLDGLSNGLPKDFEMKTSDAFDDALVKTFNASEASIKTKLIRVASQCQSSVLDQYASEIVRSLATVLADGEAEMAVRANAALELVTFQSGNAEVFSMMVRQINPQTPPMLAYELLSSIKLSTASEGGGILIRALSEMTPQVKAKAIDVLLSRPQWTAALLTAVEGQTFDLNELTLEQKRALRSFPDAKLRDRAEALLAMGGGLPDADRERVLQSLMHVTEIQGDVKAGREVFTKVCSACHKHGEIGHAIGPNLTGMAVHPKEELLTHIIDPSRNVEGNFRLYTVQTIDGLVASGMLAGESKTSITIIDSQAKEIDIPREDIEELTASRKSVMPEGFEKQISEKELANLLEFLTDKGPFLPISLDRYATAISTKGLFSNGDNGADRMIFDDWKPKVFKNIPFVLTDPRGKTTPNIILLHGPFGPLPPKMPKSVSLPCNTTAKAIHFLSGVGGWNHPYDSRQTVSMIVRLHYDDGETEDHELINGVHFADYIRRVDVPESEFAFQLGGQQLRYLKVNVKREQAIEKIELVKGPDTSAPIVMAVTAER